MEAFIEHLSFYLKPVSVLATLDQVKCLEYIYTPCGYTHFTVLFLNFKFLFINL